MYAAVFECRGRPIRPAEQRYRIAQQQHPERFVRQFVGPSDKVPRVAYKRLIGAADFLVEHLSCALNPRDVRGKRKCSFGLNPLLKDTSRQQ